MTKEQIKAALAEFDRRGLDSYTFGYHEHMFDVVELCKLALGPQAEQCVEFPSAANVCASFLDEHGAFHSVGQIEWAYGFIVANTEHRSVDDVRAEARAALHEVYTIAKSYHENVAHGAVKKLEAAEARVKEMNCRYEEASDAIMRVWKPALDRAKARVKVLEDAIRVSIARADDFADSFCSRPIREALKESRGTV